MSTIVFFMLPELGHINPSFKLAKGLQRRGHSVRYLGAAEREDNVRSQGFECISVFKKILPKGFLSSTVFDEIDKEWINDPDAFKHLIADQAKIIQLCRSEIVDFIEQYKPDLLVVDVFLPAVALLARELGIHSVFLNPGFNMYHHYFQGELAVLKGVPELVLCPQEFDLPQQAEPGNHRYYIEPSIDLDRSELPFPWERVSKDKPLIYCTLGSQSHVYGEEGRHFFRTLVSAMASKQDWQLVLAIGTALDPEDFEPVPTNVLLVRHAPQLQMLKRAAMMITHGGFGSVKECIYLGVPMIVFPLRRDQPRNAARVVYHRLGVRGDITRVSIEMIHSLIEKIDRDPRFRSNVEVMGARFRQIEALSRGVKIVEKIMTILKQKSLRQATSYLGEESISAR